MDYANYKYENPMNSALVIHARFQASAPFRIEWLLNGRTLTVAEYHMFNLTANRKHIDKYIRSTSCEHVDGFSFDCALYVLGYTKHDIGKYQAFVQLTDREDLSLMFSATPLLPSM